MLPVTRQVFTILMYYVCNTILLYQYLLTGLIIHEGSSVYRIFKRWQAVNQQWKVLNYEKSKDLGDPLSSSSKAGNRGSRSNPHGLASGSRGGQRVRRFRTILNHHCGYTILHILSQLRPSDPRLGTPTNREVVMRVTTVWDWIWHEIRDANVSSVFPAKTEMTEIAEHCRE